jgi:outer membrane protein assembly factor BamB
MKNKLRIITLTLLVTFTSIINAQDWSQYLGPKGNSTSDQKGILRSWPATGPEVLWKTDLAGRGYGGPVISKGKVYLLDRQDGVSDIMRCFDFSTGKELWKFSYDAPGNVPFPGSRSVPVVDGNYVYSCGHNGDLYCIDINTQKPVWNKNIWKDFGGARIPMFAISQCPVIYGDLLIIASQTSETGVVAYEK